MKRRAAKPALPPAPAPAAAAPPPYPPSWVNRMADWVDRRRGPAWLVYLLLGLALAAMMVALQWSSGTYPGGWGSLPKDWG